MGAWRAEAGFSLADLLASMALLGLLMAATLTVLVAGQESYSLGVARIDAQQSARIAVASGSCGGRGLRLRGEVTVTGARGGATVAGGRSC